MYIEMVDEQWVSQEILHNQEILEFKTQNRKEDKEMVHFVTNEEAYELNE